MTEEVQNRTVPGKADKLVALAAFVLLGGKGCGLKGAGSAISDKETGCVRAFKTANDSKCFSAAPRGSTRVDGGRLLASRVCTGDWEGS